MDETTRRRLPFDFLGQPGPSAIADWVSLSDYWLAAAIEQQLIRPMTIEQMPDWAGLPDIWQTLLQRNQDGFPSSTGAIWGAPYRWGNLVMVYSPRQFERLNLAPPKHWHDLWSEPWQALAGRISFPNHPRIVLGIILKSLGYSANDPNPSFHPDVPEKLNYLRRLVRVYTSVNYLQSLIQEDIWLAIGWSTDIRPVLAQYRQLSASVPDPGTLLSADVWVKPNGKSSPGAVTELTDLDQAWLSHWWQSSTTTPFSLFSQGLSPLLIGNTSTGADNSAAQLPNDVLLPSTTQLEHSEFLEPLPPDGVDNYTKLWQELRGNK